MKLGSADLGDARRIPGILSIAARLREHENGHPERVLGVTALYVGSFYFSIMNVSMLSPPFFSPLTLSVTKTMKPSLWRDEVIYNVSSAMEAFDLAMT
jgi:hypothetical protein